MSPQIGRDVGGPLIIGQTSEDGGNLAGFEGAVDELRLWSQARSGAEIADTYQSRLTGAEAGLILYLPLDSFGSDAATPDRSDTGASARVRLASPRPCSCTL